MAGAWKLPGYVVERMLGSGGSADVWRARVAASAEPVALKRIPVDDPEQARRAQSEAALLGALDHPHLVRLHALVPVDDAMVLVLDLADGGSLRDLLEARGRLSPGEVITALAPIAAALAYLHGEGVVHGDVSAANILFTTAGAPLLADVGVARLTGDDEDARSTLAYVDPAVVVGGVPGPQSDVFMLAGVALHALTGSPPWVADSAEDALALAARGVLDDVPDRLARAGVSPAMAAVIGRSLSVDPFRRGTAADLALDLRHSATPVAVELAAGRPRAEVAAWSGPRHAVVAGPRPPFERPNVGGPEPPTRMVGPRPRPVIPRPHPRRRRLAVRLAAAPRSAAVCVASILAGLLAVGGALWARADENAVDPVARTSGHPAPSSPGVPPTPGTRSTPSVPNTPSARATTSTPVARPVDWPATLAALDALRAKAFATRDAGLLRRVYLPGSLLSADAAELTRLVPVGCSLIGARTRYDHVRAGGDGPTVAITATATLSASRLVCGSGAPAHARGLGPTTLHVTLRRTAAGWRIATQRSGG